MTFDVQGHKMCRLDGRIRSKEEREEIINTFTNDSSITLFLLTTQVHNRGSQQLLAHIFILFFIAHTQLKMSLLYCVQHSLAI